MKKITYILSLLFTLTLLAQQPSYRQYTLADGLPSNQIYDIAQDSLGFLWVATSMGVSRFDGIEFTNFTTTQGLPDKALWGMTRTATGQLNFVANDGSTYQWTGQDFQQTTPSKQLFPQSFTPSGDIIIDYKAAITHPTAIKQKRLPNQDQYFERPISSTFSNAPSTLWIGTWGDGAFYCTHYQTDSLQVQAYLPNRIITAILEDQEGNIWLSTLDEGIFLLKNRTIFTYNTTNGLPHHEIHAIEIDGQTIWVGNSKGMLSKIDRQTHQITNFDLGFSQHTYNRIHDILIDAANNKWMATDEGLQLLRTNEDRFLFNIDPVRSLLQLDETAIWVGRYAYPILLDVFKGLPIDTIMLPNARITSLCKDRQQTIWLGALEGLYHYTKDSLFFWGNSEPLLSTHIMDVKVDAENRLWIATDGQGIIIKQHEVLVQIREQDGLCSNYIRRIFIDQQNIAWAATNKGLAQISIKTMEPPELNLHHYTALDGLASSQIYDVQVIGDTVYTATLNGVSTFRWTQQQRKETPPPIYLKQLRIGYRDVPIKPAYRLKHTQNNITLEFTGISYQSEGQLTYQYQMEGIDTTWRSTSVNRVQYPALSPGAYLFKVKAIDKNRTVSEAPATIYFLIQPPIWARWWFKLLSWSLLIALIIGIAYIIFMYFKNRNDWKRRMIESQQMALRAQMNPHFIFNALNSIQFFITENDKRSANLYLSTFATLIRKVLKHSQQSTISLEEELNYLELYLTIEALRFKDKFDYSITITNDIFIEEIAIPPMLIQPYIENAIQHGLLPKQDGNRQLSITFEQKETENVLICTVADNGIGRTAAAKRQRKHLHQPADRKSIGIRNPQTRLAILNQLYPQKIRVTIQDEYNQQGEPSGTTVQIRLPMTDE